MIPLGAKAALRPPPTLYFPGGRPEQAPLALHTGVLPSFGVRTPTDGEKLFHRVPPLADNAGERQLTGIHAAQQKGPRY